LLHGHSYTGNALACAAACASMDIFKENETWEDINRIVDKHADFVDQIKGHSAIFNLRQGGTILAIELNADKEKAYFGEIRDKAYKYFLDKGILLRPLGNVIFLNPPYCITDDELAYCHTEIKNFLELV
ncbi:MAG: adenosylmethionine-8-amino-7-oxononanoate aminotransferase, partial [Lentimonas sp.]